MVYGPIAGVTLDSVGDLYGTTAQSGTNGDGIVYTVSAAGVETILHSFKGLDGQTPLAGVIRDTVGNLYGTTIYGGSGGQGVVYKVDPRNKETVLIISLDARTEAIRPPVSSAMRAATCTALRFTMEW